MRTLDVFRTSVAAASLASPAARSTRPCTTRHPQDVRRRAQADFITQAKLAQMATMIGNAALLTYRAAWHPRPGPQRDPETAMAKLTAARTHSRSLTAPCRSGAAWA